MTPTILSFPVATVIDPASDRHARRDLAVADGRIVAVEPHLVVLSGPVVQCRLPRRDEHRDAAHGDVPGAGCQGRAGAHIGACLASDLNAYTARSDDITGGLALR